MTTINLVHQLGPIRDYADYLAAKQDIENLLARGFDVEMTDDEYDFIRATRQHIELFESYLELDRSKPQPRDLLAYLMARVQPVTLEVLEQTTGLSNLGTILSGHRPPTAEEAQRLTDYFSVSEDAFVI